MPRQDYWGPVPACLPACQGKRPRHKSMLATSLKVFAKFWRRRQPVLLKCRRLGQSCGNAVNQLPQYHCLSQSCGNVGNQVPQVSMSCAKLWQGRQPVILEYQCLRQNCDNAVNQFPQVSMSLAKLWQRRQPASSTIDVLCKMVGNAMNKAPQCICHVGGLSGEIPSEECNISSPDSSCRPPLCCIFGLWSQRSLIVCSWSHLWRPRSTRACCLDDLISLVILTVRVVLELHR